MYQFLENFHQRMAQVAVHSFLNEKASIKEGLRQGSISKSQALNLIMQLLCFIMEKSLLEQNCTLEDMETFLRYIVARSDIEEVVDYEGLTRYLVREALQNRGKPFYFNTYDFGEEKPLQIHIRLIEDRIIRLEGAEIFSYNLTAQGYEFLFGTLEVEESLQMSFEQLKLQYAIQKRNFGSARDSVDNLFTLNRKQIQRIREYVTRIKEDIGSFGTLEYEQTYRDTFETLNEQKEKHEKLYKLIQRTQEQYLEQNYTDNSTEKMTEDLMNIDYIKRRLQQLLGEQIKLFNEQQTLADVYDDAISNVLYIGFENRMDIEKDILEPLEKQMLDIGGMASILRPLFMPRPKRHFNFAKAYASQKIESEVLSELQEDYYLEKGEDIHGELMRERIDYVQGVYSKTVGTLLKAVLKDPKHRMSLDRVYSEVEDVELLRNVLLQLHADRVLNLRQIEKESLEHIYEPGEDFDFGYSYIKVLEDDSALRALKQIRCHSGEGIAVLVNSKDKKYLKCSNLIIEALETTI